MKTLALVLTFQTVVILSLQGQSVSNYSYKLDNGINVKSEHCWNQVWIQQSFAPMNSVEKTSPLAVNIRTLGDLISSSSFKLFNAGKEVQKQTASPGTYELKLNFKLSGKPGVLSFVIDNILIKPKTKTNVSVTLYDYQISIAETPASLEGLSSFESQIDRCKNTTLQNLYLGIPTFYITDNHDKAIPPVESISKTKSKIKAGTYDVLVTIGISGQSHKIWLEDFQFKPDIHYRVTANLNAGGITYAGANKEVKGMYLYPAGTAAGQTGTPARVKNLESIGYENPTVANCCSPGTYDVLLSYGNGTKFEWRKNVAITTGSKTEVK